MLSDGVRSFTYDYSNKLIIADGHTYTYNADVLRIRNLCENGIIYMRARYYSPEMKKFINADIVAGSITNAVTLNRFAYANGNPVSFVDPFGLSPEGISDLDSNKIYELIKKITDKHSTGLGSELLATVADQLLGYKKILVTNAKVDKLFTHTVGQTTIYISVEAESGSGNLKISSVVSEQLELLGEASFPIGDNGSVNVENDGSVSIEFCTSVNEYTMISASVAANVKSITAEYKITTSDEYDNYVSTIIGFQHSLPTLPPNKQPSEEVEYETEDEYDGDLFVAIGSTIIALGASIETFATFGVGVWNDIPAWLATFTAWSNYATA